MKIATRKKVTSKLWSYRLLNGDRIGFSPDSRLIHLPWCRYCLYVRILGWITSPRRPWYKG